MRIIVQREADKYPIQRDCIHCKSTIEIEINEFHVKYSDLSFYWICPSCNCHNKHVDNTLLSQRLSNVK